MSADDDADNDFVYTPLGAHCFKVAPDTPHDGVTFYDMQPLLDAPRTQRALTERLVVEMKAADDADDDTSGVTHVVACAVRGLFLGTWLAQALGVPLVPLRKRLDARRLVRDADADLVSSTAYTTEYSIARDDLRLCVQRGALPAGARCLVVDDVLATGGSLRAAASVVTACDATVHSCAVLLTIAQKCTVSPVGEAPIYTCFETAHTPEAPLKVVFKALSFA